MDIWWTGSRLYQIQIPLPFVEGLVMGEATVPVRYHFNTVTFGYTTAFWDFDKWSNLIDWMALRGINLPLAWNGYEHILIEVFREVGYAAPTSSSEYSEAEVTATLNAICNWRSMAMVAQAGKRFATPEFGLFSILVILVAFILDFGRPETTQKAKT